MRVDYYAEVSAIRVYKEAKADGAGKDWAARRAEEFRDGVRVRWNGTDLPLTPLSVEKPGKTTEADYVEFHIAGLAALPSTNGELRLEMGNFPDEPCYGAVSVSVPGTLVVTGSSLAAVRGGRLRDNVHGAWRRDDKARVATLQIRPSKPWEFGDIGPLPSRLEGLIPWPRAWKAAAAGSGVLGLVALGALWFRRSARKKLRG